MAHESIKPSRWSRILRKLIGTLPILAGATIFFVLIAAVLYVVYPSLPEPYRELIAGVGAGEWEESRARLQELLSGTGWGLEAAFVGMQVVQVVAAPIPGQLLGIVAGYLFGFAPGLLLTMAGLTLGSSLAMGLGRLLGDGVLRRLVPRRVVERFDALVQEGGIWNFFLLFLLPGLPDDAICFMAGMTRLPLGRLIAVCVAGRLPGMAALVYVGSEVGTSTAFTLWVGGAALAAGALLWLFSDEIELWFLRRQRIGGGDDRDGEREPGA